jgi:Zn-dependent protease/predicted transcriptional regulator
MGQRWKIATIRGIPLYIASSWFIIAVLYVFLQYSYLSQTAFPPGPTEALTLSVLATVLFFGSVLLHECAHAVMARALGLPVVAITLVFWGGATETRANERGPLGEFLVAFVGPATTLALAGLFFLASQMAHGYLSDILHYLAGISVLFAIVNALPGFPLDGGRMLVAIVWGITRSRRTGLRVAGYVGMVVGAGIAAAAVWSFTQQGGLWLFLGYLAFVLLSTGRGMDARIALRDQLAKGRAADAMRAPHPTISADLTLTQALDLYLRARPSDTFPVVDIGGRVIGTISMSSASRLGRRNPMRPVRDAMIPLVQTPVIAPEETLEEVVEWVGPRQGMVLQDGQLVGAIDAQDVERWYRRVIEGRPAMAADPNWVPPRPDR